MGLGPGIPPFQETPACSTCSSPSGGLYGVLVRWIPGGCLLGPAAAGFGFVAALLWRVEGPQQGAAESMALVAALMGRGRVG